LLARDLSNFGFVRLFRTGGDVGRFLQQNAAGGLFVMKVNDLSL
jgi:hypothetical protein